MLPLFIELAGLGLCFGPDIQRLWLSLEKHGFRALYNVEGASILL